MLQIGEFSRLSRISVRMLRHYDQVGLLKPVEQDAQTGGWRMRTTGSWPAPWTIARVSSRKASGASSAGLPTCSVSGRTWRPAGRP